MLRIATLLFSVLLIFITPIFSQESIVSYSFENKKASDDSGVYAGSLIGNAKIVPMTDGNYALYTGAGYLDLSVLMGKTIAAQLTGNYSISIDLCFGTVNSLSSFSWVYAFTNGTSQYFGLINTAGNNNWYYEIKNGTTYKVNSNNSLGTNVWHNITFVKSNNTNTIYIDGVVKSSSTITLTPSGFANNITGAYLGRSPYSGDALMTNTFIDNFKIFNSALTSAQVLNQYNTIKTKATTTTDNITSNITRVWESTGNPVVKHKYTADPAALVHNDTLFLFTGQDAAGGLGYYNIPNWCCFATTDMKHFWEYNIPLRSSDFTWGSTNSAWAGQVIQRNGKFYWYISTNTTGIGVAVADRPEGPYKDALGRALLTNSNSPGFGHSWRTIDPTVFIDDDGQAWIYWGNGGCWVAKLNEDMISIDASYGTRLVGINGIMDFGFTEAPWVHKKDGLYYLSFAAGFPERISYAVSTTPAGPYTYKGILNEIAGNSNTNHQAIVNFKNNWYLIYHNGGIQTDGGSFSRSVCIDKLEFDENKMYRPIIMTTKGVDMLEAPNINALPELQTEKYDNQSDIYIKNNIITLNVPTNYQIVDTLGHIIKTGLNDKIDISTFRAGVYMLSNGEKSWKFIKN